MKLSETESMTHVDHACAFVYAHAQSGGADVEGIVAKALLDALALPAVDKIEEDVNKLVFLRIDVFSSSFGVDGSRSTHHLP